MITFNLKLDADNRPTQIWVYNDSIEEEKLLITNDSEDLTDGLLGLLRTLPAVRRERYWEIACSRQV